MNWFSTVYFCIVLTVHLLKFHVEGVHTADAAIMYSLQENDWSKKSISCILSIDKKWIWGEDMKNDILINQDITIGDAFNGTVITKKVERTVINSACVTKPCPLCNGALDLKESALHKRILNQSILHPCTKCLGMGIVTEGNCSPYSTVVQDIEFVIPPGARPGYTVTHRGMGNEFFDKFQITTGDLTFTVLDVVSENPLLSRQEDNSLLLTVKLMPSEAMHGFFLTMPYLGQRLLQIDRMNKTTLPNTTSHLAGYGLPTSANDTERDNLIINFQLKTRTEVNKILIEDHNCASTEGGDEMGEEETGTESKERNDNNPGEGENSLLRIFSTTCHSQLQESLKREKMIRETLSILKAQMGDRPETK